MAEKVDLNGKAKLAVNGAYERGSPVILAYVDEAGRPSLSVRGSTQVLNAKQVGVWTRKADAGLAKAIASNPNVSMIFFGSLPDDTKMLLTLNGRAHADATRNHEVYDSMSETERKYDPDISGVAVIVDVDLVTGMTADGPFRQGQGEG